jgi:hypothetical protein
VPVSEEAASLIPRIRSGMFAFHCRTITEPFNTPTKIVNTVLSLVNRSQERHTPSLPYNTSSTAVIRYYSGVIETTKKIIKRALLLEDKPAEHL